MTRRHCQCDVGDLIGFDVGETRYMDYQRVGWPAPVSHPDDTDLDEYVTDVGIVLGQECSDQRLVRVLTQGTVVTLVDPHLIVVIMPADDGLGAGRRGT